MTEQQQRIDRLFARRALGIKPGLDTTKALLNALGNPERGMAIVHIAGTNGKGSVSTFVASTLRTVGFQVGLFTSPHLVKLNERFQVQGEVIEDATLDALLARIETAAVAVEQAEQGVPTFFECMTALAMLWFAQMGVHIAVLEVGMGGRLDATNVFQKPLVSVITRIGIDHTAYLGDTLAAIAAEKAGIIKTGVPVVVGAMPSEAFAVVEARARELKAPLVRAEAQISVERVSGDLSGQKVRLASESEQYGTVILRLAASYQLENVATALATIETVLRQLNLPISKKVIQQGLSEAVWPGRFDYICGESAPTGILVDGAHNPDGARALIQALRDAGYRHPLHFVVGQCADKDTEGFFRTIAPIVRKVWTVPFHNPRATSPEDLACLAQRYSLEAQACETLEAGLQCAQAAIQGTNAPIILCGSLFLVGEALAKLRP